VIIFLFGRPGSGKTFVGEKLAGVLGVPYLDCDDFYTEEDRAAISESSFSDGDSDRFMETFLEGLRERYGGGHMVATQSLFREKQRKRLKDEFGEDVCLVCLEVPAEVTFERVGGRDDSFYTLEQYRREEHEYEDVVTYDLVVSNDGSVCETIREIIEEGGLLDGEEHTYHGCG
jgi:gluconate kinase